MLNFFYIVDFEQPVFVPAADPAKKRQMRRRIANTETVSVYPSLTGSLTNIRLNISDTGYINGKIEIFTLDGRSIFEASVLDLHQQWALNVSDWPTGIFFVQLSAPNRRNISQKFEIIR